MKRAFVALLIFFSACVMSHDEEMIHYETKCIGGKLFAVAWVKDKHVKIVDIEQIYDNDPETGELVAVKCVK